MSKVVTDQVVITGVGLVSSLGSSAEQTWRGVLDGRSAAAPMPALESSLPQGTSGYQAVELPGDFAPQASREVRYLRWAIVQALQHARAGESVDYAPGRRGFVLGTTLHGMRSGGVFFRSGDCGALGSFLAGSVLQRACDGLPMLGDAVTTCSACSSSLGSIALAVTLLEAGELDLVVTGGYDTVSEYAYAGFNSLRLVADGPLRPFARDRRGMKLGEGYGILVLERESDARRRGVPPLACVLGFGESADAHHLTQPHPKGEGAASAISAALRRAGLGANAIDLVAAHATGTPDNDAGEYAALSTVFGDELKRVPVVGFKSHLGHTLGGAGAVELILSLMALRDQTIPACANVKAEEIEFPNLNLAVGAPRKASIRATLNTSLGFGGANTSVILSTVSDLPRQGLPSSPPRDGVFAEAKPRFRPAVRDGQTCPPERDQVLITGIGVVLPGAIGVDAFVDRLTSSSGDPVIVDANISEVDYAHLLNARRVRRMNDYVKLTLAATTLACQDAGWDTSTGELARSCSAILGTTHGGSGYCVSYYGQIVREGMIAANPMLFAEGVPNAAAAHLSLMLSLKGACQTVIGSRTAGLDALRLASLRIATGQWDRAIVSAAEEFGPEVNQSYVHCGLHRANGAGPAFGNQQGFAIGAGAVTLLLESRAALSQRTGRARGRVTGSAAARQMPGRDNDAIDRVLAALDQPAFVIGSANNTWVDGAEVAAVARGGRDAVLSSIYGHLPETFSVGPLASIAAVLLTGRLPPLRAARPFTLAGVRPATGDEQPDSVAILSTAYTGAVAGVTIAELSGH